MGMQIEPTKSEELKKMKNEEKTQKLKKIENEEKGNLSLEKGTKIIINDLGNIRRICRQTCRKCVSFCESKYKPDYTIKRC